jgi:hypothetical protein
MSASGTKLTQMIRIRPQNEPMCVDVDVSGMDPEMDEKQGSPETVNKQIAPIKIPANDVVESNASPMTSTWSTALFNKARMRSFLHSFHWSSVSKAEAGLYAGVLYILVDQSGSFEVCLHDSLFSFVVLYFWF